MDRNETIRQIKASLKARSGKAWSVTGGRGTVWGWITIEALPSERVECGYTSEADRATLAKLLDFDTVHAQGISIPASNAYYQEYVDRAAGRTPSKIGQRYWD